MSFKKKKRWGPTIPAKWWRRCWCLVRLSSSPTLCNLCGRCVLSPGLTNMAQGAIKTNKLAFGIQPAKIHAAFNLLAVLPSLKQGTFVNLKCLSKFWLWPVLLLFFASLFRLFWEKAACDVTEGHWPQNSVLASTFGSDSFMLYYKNIWEVNWRWQF